MAEKFRLFALQFINPHNTGYSRYTGLKGEFSSLKAALELIMKEVEGEHPEVHCDCDCKKKECYLFPYDIEKRESDPETGCCDYKRVCRIKNVEDLERRLTKLQSVTKSATKK